MVETQKIRFSNRELEILKNTFSEKDELLKSLRKVIWQKNLTEQENSLLKSIISDELMLVLRKMFLPELDGNLPIHQEIDLLMTIKIDDKTPEDAFVHIEARKLVIAYIEQQLTILNNRGQEIKPKIIFKDLTNGDTKESLYINLIARNTVITHTEQQLAQIKMLAGNKNETPEETLERLKKDSTK